MTFLLGNMLNLKNKTTINILFSILFVIFFITNTLVSLEPINKWQLGFQTPASPIFEGIVAFHDDLMVFIVLINKFLK